MEDIQDLLSCDGWARFMAVVLKDWGPVGYARQLSRAMTEAHKAGKSPEIELWAIEHTARAVGALMRWPERRKAELLQQRRPRGNPYKRGGY